RSNARPQSPNSMASPMNFLHAHLHRPIKWLTAVAMLLCLPLSGAGHAAVQVQTTRVIYDARSASAAVALSNKSTLPYMVQTWLDAGDDSTAPQNLPMVITPPLMQLAPGEQAVVRTIYAGSGLPDDRESLLWINVQEIPPTAEADNVLQVAIRTRIKLFYRPTDLDKTLDEAARSLQWRIDGQRLEVRNNSPMHITFSHLQGLATAGIGSEIELDMIAPGQTLSVPLSKLNLNDAQSLRFGYINDYGGISDVTDVPLRS
ncbi:MAG: molecular chaperone, partial [Stenotrophomonas sp.]